MEQEVGNNYPLMAVGRRRMQPKRLEGLTDSEGFLNNRVEPVDESIIRILSIGTPNGSCDVCVSCRPWRDGCSGILRVNSGYCQSGALECCIGGFPSRGIIHCVVEYGCANNKYEFSDIRRM